MSSAKPTNIRGWTAIVLLVISALIIAIILLMRKSPPAEDAAVSSVNDNISVNAEHTAAPAGEIPSSANPLNGIPVIVLNSGKEIPIEIKVGGKYIKIPGPASWPKGRDEGTAGSQAGRFVAGIIDTADVLKANGFKPNDTFSLVVGGTALNASNTYRITGNHQPGLVKNDSNGYVEEYHTLPDEQGIWRSLKFKNIVVSYGQVPSLTDFLVAPQTSPAQQPTLNQQSSPNETATLYYQDPSEMAADMMKSKQETQKYRDALNNPNPAIRAKGIEDLVLYGDQVSADNSQPGLVSYIDKALTDRDATVREAALSSLDVWDGDIPMQMLSRVVLNDESPEIRLHALSLLTDRFAEKSIPVLQQASHDPDSRVAQRAGQLLDEFTP